MTDHIEVLTHSSIRIAADAGIIYFDPFNVEGKPADADYIFITHDHYDHFSPDDIKKISKGDTLMIAPEKMRAKAQDMAGDLGELFFVEPGKSYAIGNISFETVAAYNVLKPFHPKSAGWVGYIIEADGQRIYVAGDTDRTKESEKVVCDIALVPVGGTYTMNASKAAGLINVIRPKVAIPTHYGSIVGKKEDAQTFAGLVKEPVKVVIRNV
ncbi:MAG: MBL fold metallo-hydrolase [Eubacterium sp.]|nr:MBL fold metallo-hydrolase [Eubacterium sp.]